MSESTPSGRYADEAAALDKLLDQQLGEIRRKSEASEIGPAEAAHARVSVLEMHLAKIKALRERYFGTGTGR